MRLDGTKLYLRDGQLSDLVTRRHWEFIETEWKKWDAPWEYASLDVAGLRLESQRYLDRLEYRWQHQQLTETSFRTGFEIIEQGTGRPLGWVNCYDITANYDWSPGPIHSIGLAIGIVIPTLTDRQLGYGKEALMLYIDYLASCGYREVYLQTWSGNDNMIKLADRLGFVEVYRKSNERMVRGQAYDGLTYQLKLPKRATHHE